MANFLDVPITSVGTDDLINKFRIGDLVNAITTLAPNLVKAPVTAASTGTPGQVAYDASFLYVCVAANSWKRVGIAAW